VTRGGKLVNIRLLCTNFTPVFLLSPDSLICKKIIASWYFLSPIGDFGER
jgi:hypothetical protein